MAGFVLNSFVCPRIWLKVKREKRKSALLFFQALRRHFCFCCCFSSFLFTFSNVQIEICKFAQNKCNFLCVSLALSTSLSLVIFVFIYFLLVLGSFSTFFGRFCLARFNLLQLFCAIRLLLWIVKANRHEIVLFAFRLFFLQSLLRRRRLTSCLNGSHSTFPLLPLFYVFFRFCSIVEL